jgi:uridine kinase
MTRTSTYVIGIAGPSCSGKSSLAHYLAETLRAIIVPLDSYYLDLSGLTMEERGRRNFDAPEALDWELMIAQLTRLAGGHAVDKPVYQFATHTRAAGCEWVRPAEFLIFEGLFALYHEEIRRLLGTAVFVGLDDETCLSRRLNRDTLERGRTVESIIHQYDETVRPMADRYIIPTQTFADLVLDGASPVVSMAEAVMNHIRENRGLLTARVAG